MKLPFLLFFSLISFISFGQGAKFDWAAITGLPLANGLSKIEVTSTDEVIVYGHSGSCCDTFDIDPGPDTSTIIATGAIDAYMFKIDSSGNILWSGGSTQSDWFGPADSDIDSDDNYYITGYASNDTDFDMMGPDTVSFQPFGSSSFAQRRPFVAKYRSDGSLAWLRSLYSSSGLGNSIDVDINGNVAVTGSFENIIYFNPPDSIPFHDNPSPNLFDEGTWVAKYDSLGTFLWGHGYNDNQNNTIHFNGVKTDNSENIFVSGTFSGGFDFDPGPGSTVENSTNGTDGFILKFDPAGNFEWVKTFSGTDTYIIITGFDGSGNLHLRVEGEDIDLDPGTDTTFAYGDYISVVRLSNSGNYLSSFQLHEDYFPNVFSTPIEVDLLGNSIVAFSNDEQVNLGQENGSYLIPDTALTNSALAIVCSYAPDGTLNWARSFYSNDDSGPNSNRVGDLFIAPNDEIYFSGRTITPAPIFSPVHNSFSLNTVIDSTFSYGIVGKLTPCPSGSGSLSTDSIGLCSGESYELPDGSQVQNPTDPIQFNNTYVASDGCDSTQSLYISLTPQEGEKHIYDTVCVGSSYTFWGNTAPVSISGSRIDTIVPSTAPCDSALIFHLEVWLGDPLTISNNNDTLHPSITGDSVQWYQCFPAPVAIPGATNAYYTPSNPGQYSVEVFKNGCSRQSSCFTVFSVGLLESNPNMRINIFPNPSSGLFHAESSAEIHQLKVYSATGQLIVSKKFNSLNQLDFEIEEKAGLYFIELYSNLGVSRFRVIKE